MQPRFTLSLTLAAALAATASAQNDYVWDIGSTNEVWGGGNAHTCWIQAYEAIAGGDTITEVLTAYGSPTFPGLMADGLPAQVMLYEDPNDDGDPNDAVLLWSTNTSTTNHSTDILNSYTVSPPQAVTGRFFVAAVVDHKAVPRWPAPRDTTQSSLGRAWMCRNNNTAIPFNIVNLAANDFPPTDMDVFAGGNCVFRIQANGAQQGPIGDPDPMCSALPNSTGLPSSISLTSNGLAGGLVMGTASNGPPSGFGYFISGPNAGLYSPPPGSAGIVCIAGPQYRYNSVALGQVFMFDAGGVSQAVSGGGPSLLPTDGSYAPVPVVVAGETRYFQGWYRDGPTSNFTDSHGYMFL